MSSSCVYILDPESSQSLTSRHCHFPTPISLQPRHFDSHSHLPHQYMCKLAFFQNPFLVAFDQFLLSPIFGIHMKVLDADLEKIKNRFTVCQRAHHANRHHHQCRDKTMVKRGRRGGGGGEGHHHAARRYNNDRHHRDVGVVPFASSYQMFTWASRRYRSYISTVLSLACTSPPTLQNVELNILEYNDRKKSTVFFMRTTC